MEEEAIEIASLFPGTSAAVAGLCVGHVVRAIPAGAAVRTLLNEELVEATGRARHMPQHRRTLHFVVSDCRPASARRPVELRQRFAAGEFSVRLGRPGAWCQSPVPLTLSVMVAWRFRVLELHHTSACGIAGPHKSQGGPTRYSVSVDLGRLFTHVKQRVNVDRQVHQPAPLRRRGISAR